MGEIGWWVLGGLLWIVGCWLALVFLSVPLTLLALAAGLSVGAVLSAVGYVRVYLGLEDERVLVKPSRTAPRGSSAPYPYWDDAWSGYLTGQLERDIVAAFGWPRRQVTNLWTRAGEWASPRWLGLVVVLPVVPPPVGFLVAVTAGTCGAWLAFAAASEAIVVVPRLGRWTAIAALRAGDTSVRWWHGAAATCPRCRGVTRLPAYRCRSPRCDGVHRDLRPGRLGAWCRRCRCDVRLPTTVRRAAPVMTPVCPACGGLLHERAGAVRDARIAVSGGPAAGKTQLVLSAMAGMTGRTATATAWQSADEYTTTWLHDSGPAPTTAPILLTLRSGVPPRLRYVHVIDLGGKDFLTGVDDPALRHLGTTRRHLLVLDPATIPAVRDRMDPATSAWRHAAPDDSRFAEAEEETTTAEAELPYHVLVSRLNRLGARTRSCSLAVVITKADLMARHGLAPELDPARTLSHRVRAWLCAVGLRNLVDMAEQDFGKARYFLVGLGMESTDPVAPFTWLLRQHRHGASIP